ncbi:MAG: peptidyl-prolyl cis-trans isomerase [Planctomycetota bacterium]|nr:peptidyl-prolyl cis-trans isomerase [Planctomycetota bacterium]
MRWAWIIVLLVACNDAPEKERAPVGGGADPKPAPVVPLDGPPRWVQYDHILITFRGAHKIVDHSRTKEQARELALSVLERAKSGLVRFALLKDQYSDDRAADGSKRGPYIMLNEGEPQKAAEHIPRKNAAKALADLVFRLDVGEIDMCEYHPDHSPFGWHIVQRQR